MGQWGLFDFGFLISGYVGKICHRILADQYERDNFIVRKNRLKGQDFVDPVRMAIKTTAHFCLHQVSSFGKIVIFVGV